MVTAMSYTRRISPLGGDPVIYAVTGILPYILCLYPARMMGQAIEANRALLFFPVVRPIDIILSRAIIEFFTAFMVVLLVFLIAYLLGFDLLPADPYVLVSGIISTVFLSISMGFFNNIAASIHRMWNIIFIFIVIIMYFSSGVIFPVYMFANDIQNIIHYNPLFHSVEWLRSAYFEDPSAEFLSKSYLVWISVSFLLLGLLGERFLRGKMLSS